MEENKMNGDMENEVLCPEAIKTTLNGDVEHSKEVEMQQNDVAQPRKRAPRILHFSDGIVEEFSDDDGDYEVDSAPSKLQEPPVDPKTLTWGPWLMYQTVAAGGVALKVCDYLGESLANLFGITTPKYEYEIEEYKRTMQQEEERIKKEDLEMGGWREEDKKVPQVEEPAAAVASPTTAQGDVAERQLSFLHMLLPPWLRHKISCAY